MGRTAARVYFGIWISFRISLESMLCTTRSDDRAPPVAQRGNGRWLFAQGGDRRGEVVAVNVPVEILIEADAASPQVTSYSARVELRLVLRAGAITGKHVEEEKIRVFLNYMVFFKMMP
jgi:hypothetical protein